MNRAERRDGVIVGLVCAGLACALAWHGVDELGNSDTTQGLMALAGAVFMLVGAVGGLLGPARLPSWSLHDLLFAPLHSLWGRNVSRKN